MPLHMSFLDFSGIIPLAYRRRKCGSNHQNIGLSFSLMLKLLGIQSSLFFFCLVSCCWKWGKCMLQFWYSVRLFHAKVQSTHEQSNADNIYLHLSRIQCQCALHFPTKNWTNLILHSPWINIIVYILYRRADSIITQRFFCESMSCESISSCAEVMVLKPGSCLHRSESRAY